MTTNILDKMESAGDIGGRFRAEGLSGYEPADRQHNHRGQR